MFPHEARIKNKIEEINDCLQDFIENPHKKDDLLSLMAGLPGVCLFLYEYSKYKPEKTTEHYEKIALLIGKAFEFTESSPRISTTYCDGINGFLWLTEYLRNKEVIELETDYIIPEIIQLLKEESYKLTVELDYCDLLHGGFGFWAFLLQAKDLPNRMVHLNSQLEALAAISVDIPEGRNWKINSSFFKLSDDEKLNIDPRKSIHLGMAHGIAGILVLLAKTRIAGFFIEEIEEHIHKGLQLVSSLKNKYASKNGIYPGSITNGISHTASRLAWCHGDLGIAVCYWMAWKATFKIDYKQEALRILDFCCTVDRKNTGITDAGLCHGSAGVAQIFRRMYWETGIECYLKESDKWIETTLHHANYSDGFAGYKTFRAVEYGGPHAEYGLLSGISGIGLVLLSALSNTPNDWDGVLQIS
jgi:lantibiotic biosynthesis protein